MIKVKITNKAGAALVSQLIRTAFVPQYGRKFIVSDFSAIEARVIAWFAGEQWRQEVFAQGGDIYCASASQMFHVPVEKHGRNAHLRQKGKIAEQYSVPENGNRKVAYAEKNELLQAIVLKYHPDLLKEDDTPLEDVPAGGHSQDAPTQKQRKRTSKKKGPANRQNRPLKEVAPHNRESEVMQDGPV